MDDGIEYNTTRLENSAVPIEYTNYSAYYKETDLYRLQNPNYYTDPSGTVYSPYLVEQIRKYYLMSPKYNRDTFSAVDVDFEENEISPLDEFEKEYQIFIMKLRNGE